MHISTKGSSITMCKMYTRTCAHTHTCTHTCTHTHTCRHTHMHTHTHNVQADSGESQCLKTESYFSLSCFSPLTAHPCANTVQTLLCVTTGKNETIRKRTSLAGQFVNFKGFSQVAKCGQNLTIEILSHTCLFLCVYTQPALSAHLNP